MKIKEFKAAIQYTGAVYNIDLKVTEGERAFVIEYNSKFCGVVSKGVPYFMSTSYLCFVDLDENIKRNLLAIMYELAQTPLNERIWGGRMTIKELIEGLWWMQACLLIPYKTIRDKIKIVNYYKNRGYYVEIWQDYIYCYRRY